MQRFAPDVTNANNARMELATNARMELHCHQCQDGIASCPLLFIASLEKCFLVNARFDATSVLFSPAGLGHSQGVLSAFRDAVPGSLEEDTTIIERSSKTFKQHLAEKLTASI